MDVRDLSREQIVELKQRYMSQLVDEGTFAEVMDVDYNEPSYWDLANADDLVPDDVIFRQFEDVDFVPDDFFCTANILKKSTIMEKIQLATKIWVKFCMNFPDIREVIKWMCEKTGDKLMEEHLYKKFCSWYDHSTSDGVMTRFYCELDSTYQKLLTEYAFTVWAPHGMRTTYELYCQL